ncbi:hypothetical protein PHYPSEUDO_012654 [Phytophthora pseudosyringae]|uniref:PH domain-containing protein n=1 Tax=Phytophthora pseudosyringae TaxID=221518 RepID=A0A8T1VBD6_9STRA|nr:hypothetical protein PHYPSEUDO_012654 [Phytophthora pseudosyringae]
MCDIHRSSGAAISGGLGQDPLEKPSPVYLRVRGNGMAALVLAPSVATLRMLSYKLQPAMLPPSRHLPPRQRFKHRKPRRERTTASASLRNQLGRRSRRSPPPPPQLQPPRRRPLIHSQTHPRNAMRLVREARRLECETQRRESRRSHLKKWLDLSHGHASDEDQCPEDQKQQGEAPFGLSAARRATPVSPLPPSLKKAQSPLAVKWSSYIEAMGLKDTSDKQRRVRFADKDAEQFERPECTDEEKANYHYSGEELGEMEAFAKQLVHRESRFAGQPEDTILEQGFLSLPVNAPFFQSRRYYCLLRGHRLQMYSSAPHAAKNSGMKTQLTILRVQDCQTLSMQKKFALFGASLPAQIGLMFYVIKANGERVIFTADTKSSKRNWVHSLTRLTYVGEGKCYTNTPPLRTRAISAPTPPTCILPPVPEVESEEEMRDEISTLDPDRRNSCTAVVCG